MATSIFLSVTSSFTVMQANQPPEAANAAPRPAALSDALLEELEQALAVLREYLLREGEGDETLALIRTVQGISGEGLEEALPFLARKGWFALSLNKPAGQAVQAVQKELEALFYQRDHDPLTGLANKRLFSTTLEREMQRSSRTKTELSLIMIDIDNFKQVNDQYGHVVGDEVLARLGDTLRHSVRPYDLAARIGGEEFCLILPGASSWKARTLGRRILETFRQEEFSAGDKRFNVTFSAGVVTTLCSIDCMTDTELLAKADAALYQAKRDGKNRIALSAHARELGETPSLVQAEEKRFLFFGGTE
ncbi:GGDEF domain-containing protein [Desulfovibrio sp. OttesenSCG-928-I05]|nr:GGDEF domain-containing protein [Desulfovibrio sp. OttesenSCG-928-I05]